jgi:hypothetical protein
MESDTPSSSHPPVNGKLYTLTVTPCWWWKGIHPHVYTLLVVERDTPSRSHPAGGGRDTPSSSQPAGGDRYTPQHSHPVVDGKGYTLMFTPCWWWKRIHPHVYTLLLMERYTPQHSHPAGGERDTLSCSHPAVDGK